MLWRLAGRLVFSRRGPALIASTVAINVLSLGSSLYSIQLLNRYVTLGLTPTLVSLTVGVLIAIAAELALRRQRQHVLTGLTAQWDRHASDRLFKAFAVSRYEALNEVPLPQRREALGAPTAMQQVASSNNLAALLDLPFALMFIAAAALLYVPLGGVALMACIVVLGMGMLAERGQRASADEHAKANSRATQLGQFMLAAGEVVRTLPVVGPLAGRWAEVQGASLSSRRRGLDIQSGHQNAAQSVGQFLTVGVYALGSVAAVQGIITTGALIGASILATRAFAVCSRASYLADPSLRARRADAALRRIEAVEREPEGGATPAALRGRLELVDLAFAYPRQLVPLFERLSLELEPGKVVVLSGPNGAGKSTLMRVMLGLLLPQRGMVRCDGIELRQLSQPWWRARVGYAPQDAVFFDGTLRENLVLDRDVPDERLLELIREMGLEGFLAADPAGLDRPLASHDTGLAAGMRRRFALIRAILGDPQVVFLDDPTEGLDQAGQAAVARLLNRLVQEGRTLVVASNEAFILRAADMVVDLSSKPVPKVGLVRPAAVQPEPPVSPQALEGVPDAST